MIKIPKEVIIQKIKEKTGMSDAQIKSKIKDKLDVLSGLISEEGAAHILANELGVKLFEETGGSLQIKNVLAGMKNVEVSGKVIRIYETRTFDKDNRKGKVGSFLLGDETGVLRVTAWNDKADLLASLKENQLVKIENGYTKENNGRVEIHLGDRAALTVTGEAPPSARNDAPRERKKIKDLNGKEDNIEIMGTIVQVFDPKFFEVCPDCGKRAKQRDEGFYCEQHGTVTPGYSCVTNLLLDDGTESIRVVLWKNQTIKLFNLSEEELAAKRGSSFEELKNDLLGKIVKFVGRSSKNEMFDRVEFIAQLVLSDPDPQEELDRLKKEETAKKPKEEPEPQKKAETKQSESKPKKETKAQAKKSAQKEEEFLEEIDDLNDLDSI